MDAHLVKPSGQAQDLGLQLFQAGLHMVCNLLKAHNTVVMLDHLAYPCVAYEHQSTCMTAARLGISRKVCLALAGGGAPKLMTVTAALAVLAATAHLRGAQHLLPPLPHPACGLSVGCAPARVVRHALAIRSGVQRA